MIASHDNNQLAMDHVLAICINNMFFRSNKRKGDASVFERAKKNKIVKSGKTSNWTEEEVLLWSFGALQTLI
jgi:hypothetical protein